MNIIINYKNKKITLDVKKLKGLERYRGLIFKKRNSEILLFEFKKDVKLVFHSLFVFFPFLLLWLDNNNRIIEYHRVNPFTPCVFPRKPFRKVVEIPISPLTRRFLTFFDGKGKV